MPGVRWEAGGLRSCGGASLRLEPSWEAARCPRRNPAPPSRPGPGGWGRRDGVKPETPDWGAAPSAHRFSGRHAGPSRARDRELRSAGPLPCPPRGALGELCPLGLSAPHPPSCRGPAWWPQQRKGPGPAPRASAPGRPRCEPWADPPPFARRPCPGAAGVLGRGEGGSGGVPTLQGADAGFRLAQGSPRTLRPAGPGGLSPGAMWEGFLPLGQGL